MSQSDQELAQHRQDRVVARINDAADHLANAHDAIAEVVELLAAAKKGNDHVVMGYRTWHAYVEDAVTRSQLDQKNLPPTLRNLLIEALYDDGEGISQRAAARALGTSPSVANDVVKGKKPGEKQGGATRAAPQIRRNPAVKLADAIKEWIEGGDTKSTQVECDALRETFVLGLVHIGQKTEASV